MALTAAVVGLGVASSVQEKKAATKTRRAERRARQVENAVSRFENQKAIRQRVAQQRGERAELEQGAEAAGVAGSSSLLGAVSSGQSTAAGDIGLALTRASGAAGAASIRSAGAKSASGNLAKAGLFGAGSSVSSLFTDVDTAKKLGSLIR